MLHLSITSVILIEFLVVGIGFAIGYFIGTNGKTRLKEKIDTLKNENNHYERENKRLRDKLENMDSNEFSPYMKSDTLHKFKNAPFVSHDSSYIKDTPSQHTSRSYTAHSSNNRGSRSNNSGPGFGTVLAGAALGAVAGDMLYDQFKESRNDNMESQAESSSYEPDPVVEIGDDNNRNSGISIGEDHSEFSYESNDDSNSGSDDGGSSDD